jgi:peptide/nickel transport system ATP-binding protein
MSAVPVPDPEVEDRRERILLVGDLPSPAAPPPGCRFHTRCPWRQETRCHTERPELKLVQTEDGSAHKVACHWVEEIRSGQIRPRLVSAVETGSSADVVSGAGDDVLDQVEGLTDTARGMA